MAFNCNFVGDSQNFTLRLSEGSTYIEAYEDTLEPIATDKTEDKDDIIVISDSSCSSSPEYTRKPKLWSSPASSTKNKKKIEYKKLYFLDSPSKSEEEKFSSPWRMPTRSNIKCSDTHINKNSIQVNKVFYTSDETTNSSENYDRDQINQSKIKKLHKNSPIAPAKTEINLKVRGKYNVEETNKVITPSSIIHDSPNVFTRLNKLPTYHTPRKDSTGKVRLTKQDTHKILRNIKNTQVIYNSPGERKETNVIINESTDIEDEDIIHPAISSIYNRKINNVSDSSDTIDTNLKDIIPDSQTDLSKPSKTHIKKFCDTPKKEDLHRPLSEKKKKQIVEWLMASSSDSQSDSSCSNIPPTVRNSRGSGNSSLERLELNYETPNNRERINKEYSDKKQATIMNSDKAIRLHLTHQTTLDKYFKKSKNNFEFCTSDKPKPSPKVYTNKKISSSVKNTPENMGVTNCADILDKLYGKSWRDKASVLLPTTEPRKTSIQAVNRVIQTERKPVLKNKYMDSDSDESDLGIIKINRGKNIQQKPKEVDSFINDESLSSNDSESIYHTALTNPRTSTNSTSSKPLPVSASVKRLQTICDSDTEDESKTNSNSKKNLGKKKLSFSDDESSDTSEFEPGDYVPPKYVHKKEVNKTTIAQPPKVTSKFGSTTTNKPSGYKSFLESLSDRIPMNNVHPDARKYRLDYKNNKEELCKKLYKLYNEKVFANKLTSDMPIEWNVRMRGTAGFCYNKKSIRSLTGVVKSSRIVLATKVVDSPDRLRDTLIHEMCHAAVWLLNDVSDGHGFFWTAWANKAIKTFPELPPIRRCHEYNIKTKFTYRCTSCGYSIGRHSKSLDIEKKRCGHCYGKFELLINKTTKSGTIQQVQTPKKEPTGFALYVKENYNSVKKEKSSMKHADVMKILGQQFSAIKIAKKNDQLATKNDENAVHENSEPSC